MILPSENDKEREVEIYKFTGTTSLSDGYQRLPSKTINQTWAQIRNTYRYIMIVQLEYGSAQTSAEFGNYFPASSIIIPTDIRSASSGSNYVLNNTIVNSYTKTIGRIQLSWWINNNITVDYTVLDNTSTTYQVGYAIYGIK